MILVGALDRGLSFSGVKEMDIGAIVDYCIEYNDMHDEKKQKSRRRKATQADWDRLFS